MNNWEAKEHRRSVLATALLRNHVRKLLEAEYKGQAFLGWFEGWRKEAIDLFDRKHWWDLDLNNTRKFADEFDEVNPDTGEIIITVTETAQA